MTIIILYYIIIIIVILLLLLLLSLLLITIVIINIIIIIVILRPMISKERYSNCVRTRVPLNLGRFQMSSKATTGKTDHHFSLTFKRSLYSSFHPPLPPRLFVLFPFPSFALTFLAYVLSKHVYDAAEARASVPTNGAASLPVESRTTRTLLIAARAFQNGEHAFFHPPPPPLPSSFSFPFSSKESYLILGSSFRFVSFRFDSTRFVSDHSHSRL